jgi:hypothetical protein
MKAGLDSILNILKHFHSNIMKEPWKSFPTIVIDMWHSCLGLFETLFILHRNLNNLSKWIVILKTINMTHNVILLIFFASSIHYSQMYNFGSHHDHKLWIFFIIKDIKISRFNKVHIKKKLSDSTHVVLLMKYSKNHNKFEKNLCTFDKGQTISKNKITRVQC